MPSGTDILRSLQSIVDALTPLAIAWHVAIVVVLIALALGWRPRARIAVWLAITPLVSVSASAFSGGNLFNGLVFATLAFALAAIGAACGAQRTAPPARWSTALGLALIAFGFMYPHFVDGAWYRALYAAPVGIVPCPTLAVVAGFTLLARGFSGRAIAAVLAVGTAFYALFGIARLGVIIDVGLVVAACGLLALIVRDVRIHSSRGAHGILG